MTDETNIGESVGQGTMEGAAVSAVNLDNGTRDFFRNSDNEVSYANLLLGPVLTETTLLD